MAATIGIWNTSATKAFDYTLVPHHEEEYFDLFLDENAFEKCKKVKLKPSVSVNPEIFAWFVALSFSDDEVDIDSSCCDTSSGYVICLLQEFFKSFSSLDIDSCRHLYENILKIDFRKFYMYKINWLLDELLNFGDIFKRAFLDTSPLSFTSQQTYEKWWDQPLTIRKNLDEIKEKCDLNSFDEIKLLAPLKDLYLRIDKGLGQWAGLTSLQKLEASAGYFMALAEYWLNANNMQMSLLCIHRCVDCVLILMAYQDGQIHIRSGKMKDNENKYVEFKKNFNKLYYGGKRAFSGAERRFILDLNDCRNYLRETHGFRVVSQSEVTNFTEKANAFLANLQPDIRAYSFKERFTLNFHLPLKLIFDVESGIDSFLDGSIIR